MEENRYAYPKHQQQQQQDDLFKSNVYNGNMLSANDTWHSSTPHSNINSEFLPFSGLFDADNCDQYETTDNDHYQPLSDASSTYLADFDSYLFPHTHPVDIYSAQLGYHSPTTELLTNSYQNLHPTYIDTDVIIPSTPSSVNIALDYQSISPQWDLSAMEIRDHDVSLSPHSSKQPCFVCHDVSSGYHFGAYTCESCKAFYRRVTKDPDLEIKHSCEIPFTRITKLNRKDCRACRKAQCDRVGMIVAPKDRPSQTKASSNSSLLPIHQLLRQLTYELTCNQLFTSATLENLLRLLDLPSMIPVNFDYHSLYMTAIHIWRNQYHHSTDNDTFAVLLFLFYSLMIPKENQSGSNLKFDKLLNILQQEIHRISDGDHRLACRMKALFMKCYVTLAQYYPNSTPFFNGNS